MAAIIKEHVRVIELLISAGCDVLVRTTEGLSALAMAAIGGRKDIVTMLLDAGADVDAADIEGRSPLHRAADRGSEDIVEALIKAGANVEKKTLKGSLTPLHRACHNGHYKCAFRLICAGANSAAIIAGGFFPNLHALAKNGDTDLIELLLSAGADVNITEPLGGRTPLMTAARYGHVKAVELLCDAGSDPNSRLSEGHTALCSAVCAPSPSNLKVVKVLLERGASAKGVNKEGLTVFHYAALSGAPAAVLCALFKAGADPTARSNRGRTAAELARLQRHSDTAKMLDLLAAKHEETKRREDAGTSEVVQPDVTVERVAAIESAQRVENTEANIRTVAAAMESERREDSSSLENTKVGKASARSELALIKAAFMTDQMNSLVFEEKEERK